MSRIGKKVVAIPNGVSATLDGQTVTIKGPKGELTWTVADEIAVAKGDDGLSFSPRSDSQRAKAMWGLSRTLVANMVQGVSGGFTRELDLVGVGFRASRQGGDLLLTLGYSHPIRYTPPEGITIEVPVPTQISISGSDKEIVGQVAAKIRSFRKPEPYKGKGILYRGEKLRRKAGKSGKAGKTK